MSQTSNVVSLVKYTSSPDSLRNAIDRCHGFEHLKKSDKVLIKPNLVTWDTQIKMAPYGVFTTTRLVEDLIILLKEFGCSDISIGESTVAMSTGGTTNDAFVGLGYDTLSKKYGVNLIDFNKSPSVNKKTPTGIPLSIAKEAIEADFFIDIPVLKTHSQTKVSLGIKNLKGCLKLGSKKLCHDPKYGLEKSFPHISDFVQPSLTIIDGIYALERGALHFGTAIRKDIIIASQNLLAADLIGAKTIGYNPQDIVHFQEYATNKKKSLNLADYMVSGEDLEKLITPLKWDWNWNPANTGPAAFDKMGIKGVALPKYDESLCSGCSPLSNMMNIFVMSAFSKCQGQALPSIEIINGKKTLARSGYEKTILLGNCIIKANEGNQNIKNRIECKGCPPSYDEVIKTLKDNGLSFEESSYAKYLTQQSEKYNGKPEFSWDFFQPKLN